MKEKLKNLKGKAIAALGGSAAVVASVAPAFAADTVVTANDWASVITAMTGQISVSTVIGVLATLMTSEIGLVFMWWGVRKAIETLMSAFRSGQIHL